MMCMCYPDYNNLFYFLPILLSNTPIHFLSKAHIIDVIVVFTLTIYILPF